MTTRKVTFAELTRGIEIRAGRTESLAVSLAVTCVRLRGLFFDTNKDFLLPSAMEGMQLLVRIYREHVEPELLVVGHTDRSGEADFNDGLSLARAEAVAAYLSDDVEAWLQRYDLSIKESHRWGSREDSLMLQSLADFDTRPAGQPVVEWFQETRALAVDGDAGPETRGQLIKEYMAHDHTTLPQDCVLETHGCGENFPPAGQGGGSEGPDDDERARRVEIFVFDAPGILPRPPASNSKPGSAEYPAWLKRVTATHDLDGQHVVVHASQVRYRLRGNSGCVPLADVDYKLDVPGRVITGRTDADGLVAHNGLPAGDFELTIAGHKTVLPTLPAGSEPMLHEVRGFSLAELD